MQEGNVLEASWNPGQAYLVRNRKAGTEAWNLGFDTPLRLCCFVDLKPDCQNEMPLCTRNASAKGKPQLIHIKTAPIGNTDNVIPFPEH